MLRLPSSASILAPTAFALVPDFRAISSKVGKAAGKGDSVATAFSLPFLDCLGEAFAVADVGELDLDGPASATGGVIVAATGS